MKFYHYIIVLIFIQFSCSNFEEINTDPARASETLPEYLLANAEKSATDLIYHQYYNARQGMQLAQYWMGTDKTSDGRYLFTDDGIWSSLYSGPLADLREIHNYYDDNPEVEGEATKAAAEILEAWIFHILSDLYVDVPYSQSLMGEEYIQPQFDTGESIYTSILNSLSDQIEILNNTSTFIIGDIIAGGDKDTWIKFANALRLRIAMRMIDVRESEAREIIEEAAQNTISSSEENVFFPYNESTVSNRFPFNDVERPIIQFAVTTTMIDYLKEVNDPRLSIYASVDETNGEYIGKDYGQEANDPTVIELSKPGSAAFSGSAKGYIITYAEVAFTLAEAAARGMNVGQTAEEWYQEGIEASMVQWGIEDQETIDQYIEGVPYDSGSWNNVIGTQKWLAMYMQGLQAWFERLRMDFKKPNGEDLFVAPVSGSLDPDVEYLPGRLLYPTSTKANNTQNSEEASQRIGGDSQATKNWWDVK
ncbi:SusD/RagB family nutrient-binding outer membrane lipoprotein [Membranihabitans maritimus]|uniref:SusD/RagB family nutrient-binding outer membrane lipoprotein n=1 Tax=Membranihabitans maritimus TaxID=2904244 RepID=UPI001F1680AE|nr:SusD/RagB family nutrient-binding outer membrane lipoprotein [Membranihabitans maritimus]